MNTIERFLVLCLVVVAISLIVRYARGTARVVEAVTGGMADIFKTLAALPAGRA